MNTFVHKGQLPQKSKYNWLFVQSRVQKTLINSLMWTESNVGLNCCCRTLHSEWACCHQSQHADLCSIQIKHISLVNSLFGLHVFCLDYMCSALIPCHSMQQARTSNELPGHSACHTKDVMSATGNVFSVYSLSISHNVFSSLK